MRVFGNYILSGQVQAIGVISFLSLLYLLVPPLGFLASGAAVGLVILRKTGVLAIQIVLGSLLMTLGFALILGFPLDWTLELLLSLWIPVYICSLVLKKTESQAAMSIVVALIAAAYVIFSYISIGDVEARWRNSLIALSDQGFVAGSEEQRQLMMDFMPPLLNAAMAAIIVISMMATMLVARWWQSGLFNPGGFRKEFHAFGLPKQLALPTVVAIGLLFIIDSGFSAPMRDLLVVIVILYMFQGIASIHRIVLNRAMSRTWLVTMYCLLVLLPQLMVIFIAWIGMTDSMLNVRISSDDNEG
jgi:hypothetical protein